MVAPTVEMARRLLDAGASVNASRTKGKSALRSAVSSNEDAAALVSLLLERGADVNTSCPTTGMNALQLAISNDRADIVSILLAADPPVELDHMNQYNKTALMMAVKKNNNLPMVKLLLDAGASPRAVDGNGSIPLMLCKSPDAVKMLVDAAPDVVCHTDNKRRSVLSYMKSVPMAKQLFSSCVQHNIRVDVNHTDRNQDTALHIAMLKRRGPLVVKLLLKKGSDVFGVGYGGTTVLMKPFLTVDEDVIAREYDGFRFRVGARSREAPDEVINDCLKTVLSFALTSGTGTGTGARSKTGPKKRVKGK
jgi:ankyrin repeat protein